MDKLPATLFQSPFAGHQPGSRPNRTGQVGLQISAGLLGSVTLVSTWHTGLDTLLPALGAALGVALPVHTGDTVQADDGLVMRVGPEEFLIVSDEQTGLFGQLRQSITPDTGSVTDLSHARCRIRLQGPACVDTLGKLFPVDLREPSFGLNEVRLTGHHHVPCVLHRLQAQAFDLFAFTTYAHDQLGTLLDAALEYGVELLPES